jgi:hypothetical protein
MFESPTAEPPTARPTAASTAAPTPGRRTPPEIFEDPRLPRLFADEVGKVLADIARNGVDGAKLPAHFRTQAVRESFRQAFEAVGGSTRLALWANENYDRFLQLFGRMLATEVPGASADKPMHIVFQWEGSGTRFANTRPAVEDAQIVIEKRIVPTEPAPVQLSLALPAEPAEPAPAPAHAQD